MVRLVVRVIVNLVYLAGFGVIVDDAIFAVVLVKRRFGKIFEKYFVILLAVWQIRRTFVVEMKLKHLEL